MHTHTHTHMHKHVVLSEARGIQFPGAGVTGDCELLIWVQRTELRSSERADHEQSFQNQFFRYVTLGSRAP